MCGEEDTTEAVKSSALRIKLADGRSGVVCQVKARTITAKRNRKQSVAPATAR